jgi:hypothetical protein
MEFLEENGFVDEYDFLHLPRCMRTHVAKGFAFINFTSHDAADRFIGFSKGSAGHRPFRWSAESSMTQGLEANMTKWATARNARVRDPDMLPYLRALRPFGDVNPSDVIPPVCRELLVPFSDRSERSYVNSTDGLESHPALLVPASGQRSADIELCTPLSASLCLIDRLSF